MEKKGCSRFFRRVKLKRFDPTKEKWNKIQKIVTAHGGEWMGGLGKNSHWRFQASTPQKQSELAEIVDDLERLLTRLRKVAY